MRARLKATEEYPPGVICCDEARRRADAAKGTVVEITDTLHYVNKTCKYCGHYRGVLSVYRLVDQSLGSAVYACAIEIEEDQ